MLLVINLANFDAKNTTLQPEIIANVIPNTLVQSTQHAATLTCYVMFLCRAQKPWAMRGSRVKAHEHATKGKEIISII